MTVSADLSKYLDKAYEDRTLSEVLAAPVSALAGVTDSDAELLQAAFNIKTVADLGRNKYFRRAGDARPHHLTRHVPPGCRCGCATSWAADPQERVQGGLGVC